jgi:hypothetical protein
MAIASSDFSFIECKWAPHVRPLAGFNLWSAFSNGRVAIEQLLFLVDKARSQGVAYLKRTLHGLDFLFGKVTGAHTTKHPVVRIHMFLLLTVEKSPLIPASKKGGIRGDTLQLPEHSPSNWPTATRVHAVNVLNPPLTCTTSCSSSSRAPWRTNTLFWLFMLSPSVIGPVERAQASKAETANGPCRTR